MIGLLVLVVGAIYLAVLVFATGAAYRWAAKRGLPKSKRMLAAAGGFLIVYLPVFWDHIPTLVMHKYYCEKEAGFWVYKTLEQWKTENPGVIETLVDNSSSEKYPNWPTEDWRNKKLASINNRFGMLYKSHLSNPEEGELFLNVWRWQIELLDKKTGEVLARRVDFSTGNGGYIGGVHSTKFWLRSDGCINGGEDSKEFGEFLPGGHPNSPIRGHPKFLHLSTCSSG